MTENRPTVDLLNLLDQAQATQRGLELKVAAHNADAQRYCYAYTVCRDALRAFADPGNWSGYVSGPTFTGDVGDQPPYEMASKALGDAEAKVK